MKTGNREDMEQVLGIDVGSASVSIAAVDKGGQLAKHTYALHHGDFRGVLQEMIRGFRQDELIGLASPKGKISFTGEVNLYDPQVSILEAAAAVDPATRSVLHVGAERFYLIELDQDGNYLQTSHSSSCAAGTGSFLDQQSRRLNLGDASHLSDMALKNQAPIPDIAARCSVFAKTDLIHAQQSGFSMEAICDSLCKGLADNISDVLFHQSVPRSPIYMSGGVSRNRSVIRHLQRILGKEIRIHPCSHIWPAYGAALLHWKRILSGLDAAGPVHGEILVPPGDLDYHYDPLGGAVHEPEGPGHPAEPDCLKAYNYQPAMADHTAGVLVNLFAEAGREPGPYYLGIDVGSTSTKAILAAKSGRPFAGFYTYTSGQPLKAVQALFEAIDRLSVSEGIPVEIRSCGTTGSGRKFIGGIVGADQELDEITAHARAALELDPEIDTIIEIGGQDAKFTRMEQGRVTFSHMNTVCAAGTGSFIEELAGRLGVGLEDYEDQAMHRPAPLASDRCTVFMERDINQLLSQGYTVQEVLATVIHSVRENYLKRVASEAHIGEKICFQGATAKNRALVAAFEQRLGKPVHVSPLCHLTGALGTALLLMEEHTGRTRFRGLDLYKRSIPVHTESCELCLNHCSITVARVNGEKQAYGFLCGRDYDTKKFVSKRHRGFELLRERKKLMRQFTDQGTPGEGVPVVGIPATLHMAEDIPYWTAFFHELGIPVVSSDGYKDSLKTGKKMAGAEFCAPVDSMYGHVSYLAGRCDYVFMPVYLESRWKPGHAEENFCYYTQYSSSLAHLEEKVSGKLVSPLLDFNRNAGHNAKIIQKSLTDAGMGPVALSRVNRALKSAEDRALALRKDLVELFRNRKTEEGEVSVALLGRPYVVLSDALHKGIPDIFTRMGVQAWYQDMLPVDPGRDEGLNDLLRKIPWHFAADILRSAELVARTRGLYPVLVTAFKCAPDSFITDYFKQVMHLFAKPFLIIQIDEHDSNVGYETRIEAALRSFKNHARNAETRPAPDLGGLLPKVDDRLNGKVLLMPNWDPFVGPLVVANLRRSGMDARLLDTSEMGIRRSMVHNTGQCLPINIIAQDYIDYIEKNDLDPSRAILWMMEGRISCNLRQYPYYIKRILEKYGKGLEEAGVYSGEISHREMSVGVTYYAYFAYMLGGLFRKTACRIRPYEAVPGQTDQVFRNVHGILLEAMSGRKSIDRAVREGMQLIGQIEYDRTSRRPLVAIFGDLYVRDNEVMNQGLVGAIEDAGGEALVTPYHDYMKIVIENIFRRAGQRGEHVETSMNRILLNVLKFMDDRYYKPFERYLGPVPRIRPRSLEKHLATFHISRFHSGESYDNILKIFYLLENYPEVALFVQTNPSYCCPALVTEAMTRKIREITGVPIVTLTYDGTSDRMNDAIVPYIQNAAGGI